MIERTLYDDQRPGRARRGETLRLPRAADAPMPAVTRRAGWRSARFAPERAAAERAFAEMKHRQPGTPLELPGEHERRARFGAVDRALREEWRRLRHARDAEGG